MKILLLNHNIQGKGTYIRCFNFAKHLVRYGNSVVLLTSTPRVILKPKKEMIDGVEVIYMPDFVGKRLRNGGLGALDTAFRCLYILKNRFDIVENFDHRPVVLYPAILSKFFLKTPLVSEWTDLHGTGGSLSLRPMWLQKLIGPYENYTERKSKKIADKLIVISEWLKDKAIQIGIPKSNIKYIPGGADVENITPRPKDVVRKEFNLPIDKKIIGYTAGTHYDQDLFLKTIYLIQKTRKDVILITTGDKFGSALKGNVYDPERIIEFGFLSFEKYAALLPAVDVFLFPFTNRPLNKGRWPNKIGDYMASGRPTVSNRTGDLVKLFNDHNIGLLSSEDPAEFASKTLEILNNFTLSKKIENNARQTAEKYYDWKLLTRKLEKCFLEITNKHVT